MISLKCWKKNKWHSKILHPEKIFSKNKRHFQIIKTEKICHHQNFTKKILKEDLQAGGKMIPDGNSNLQKGMKSTESDKCECIYKRHLFFPLMSSKSYNSLKQKLYYWLRI